MAAAITQQPLYPSSPLASSQPASHWNVFGCEDSLTPQEDDQQVCSSPVEQYEELEATDEDEAEQEVGDSAIVYEDGELSPGFDASFASSMLVPLSLSCGLSKC